MLIVIKQCYYYYRFIFSIENTLLHLHEAKYKICIQLLFKYEIIFFSILM